MSPLSELSLRVSNELAVCSIEDGHDQSGIDQTSDLAVSIAVKYLADNHPPVTARARRQLHRHVAKNLRMLQEREQETHATNPDKCGFFFLLTLIGAVFSWLIGKVCDHVWEVYQQSHATEQGWRTFASMATEASVTKLSPFLKDFGGEADDEACDGQ